MNRKDLINRLVARKMNANGPAKAFCICMAGPATNLCFATTTEPAKLCWGSTSQPAAARKFCLPSTN
jgi:hypothetical protein